MRRLRTGSASLLVLATLLLSSCGYTLVGSGQSQGAIPADTRTVSLSVTGFDQVNVLSQLRTRLASDRYALIADADVIDQQAHASLVVMLQPLAFDPSAYDAAGVATQYRMHYRGELKLMRAGEVIWQSGMLQRAGEVYVTAGPASIEAARIQLLADLRKQWLQDALGRLRSGF